MERLKRKSIRLKYYDYSNAGMYFVTVCVKDKKCVLGKIVGEGLWALPQTQLTNIGSKVKDAIEYIDKHYKNISIDNYVIMPNHIHILISVYNNGTSRSPSPTNEIIPSFVGTLKRFVNKEIGDNIFQRSFVDHIIRNERDYIEHYTYIENNPTKWELDDLY